MRNVPFVMLALVGLGGCVSPNRAMGQCPGGVCPVPSRGFQTQYYGGGYSPYQQPFDVGLYEQPGPVWSVEVDVQMPQIGGHPYYQQPFYAPQPGVAVYRTPPFQPPHVYRHVVRQRYR